MRSHRSRGRSASIRPAAWSPSNLPGQAVVSPGGSRYAFDISQLRKEALVEGLDELGLTLKREPQIAAFEAADRARRPWIHKIVERT